MSTTNLSDQKISKKEARLLIYTKLADTLSEYNKGKKFETKLKKASKLFATSVVKASHQKSAGDRRLKNKAAKNKTPVKQSQEAVS